MAAYVWRARTMSGEVQSGEIEADNEGSVVAQLRRNRLVPLSVKPKPREISFSFGERVGIKDLVIFTRQFATMINAGLPLVQSLDFLG